MDPQKPLDPMTREYLSRVYSRTTGVTRFMEDSELRFVARVLEMQSGLQAVAFVRLALDTTEAGAAWLVDRLHRCAAAERAYDADTSHRNPAACTCTCKCRGRKRE